VETNTHYKTIYIYSVKSCMIFEGILNLDALIVTEIWQELIHTIRDLSDALSRDTDTIVMLRQP
jgi:hypothetical protein